MHATWVAGMCAAARRTHTAITPKQTEARKTAAIGRGLGNRRGARQIDTREEEGDLDARRLRGVGAVRGVLLDVGAELASHRALGRLLRVRRPHQVAPALDRVLALEHADERRA